MLLQTHGRRPMSGRDPHEEHRASTSLELLFDLTFVIAFGTAANELAHGLAEDHVGSAVVAFCFATFAVSWAWINFSWFASAFDCDDWVYRLTTMLQMVGVLVLALGIPDVFASIEEGAHVDNAVLVGGYVVMRVAMVGQWLRAAREAPEQRDPARAYVVAVLVAQLGWIALLLAPTTLEVMLACAAALVIVELAGPLRAERLSGGTPWHPHHIAERYGLLVIIALGEGMIGTMASMTAIIGSEGPGWSWEFVVVGVAGVALTFGIWWVYFVLPHGEALERHRHRSFGWGYGHIPLFGAVVAVGVGLHVAAYDLEDHTTLSTLGTVLAVVVPVALFLVLLFVLQAQLLRRLPTIDVVVALLGLAVLGVGLAVASLTGALAPSLAVVALSPWVVVVAHEAGLRHRGHPDPARPVDDSVLG